MCSVDVSELKAELIETIDSFKEGILAALRERVMQSSSSLIELFQLTEIEVSKVSSTGEEVLALKKTILKEQLQHERMKETIQHNKDTIAFLVEHQLPISQEVRFWLNLMYACHAASQFYRRMLNLGSGHHLQVFRMASKDCQDNERRCD